MRDGSVPLVDLHAQHAALRGEIDRAIARVLDRQLFVIGPETRAFEEEFADFCGTRHAVAVANGTVALELVLWALGVGPGDEVVTVSATFWATVEAILRVGAVPVFVDIRDDDWTMDPGQVTAAVTPSTKAVLPVHLYGHPADVPAIRAAAPETLLIEDAAQAHGATYRGAPLASASAGATFSFFPAKNLGAYGDAGAVVTNDDDLAGHVRALRDHGRSTKYEHPRAGTNARSCELQCAILRTKLPHLAGWTAERRRLARSYENRLDLPYQHVQPWASHARHLFVVRHPDRDRLRDLLAEEGIETGVHYPIPAHLQEGLAGTCSRAVGALTATENLAASALSLPLYPELGDEGVDRVCGALERALEAVPA